MTIEKPQVRFDVELGLDFAFTVLAGVIGDQRDSVGHQHGWLRQPAIRFAEHLAPAALDQVIIIVGILACRTITIRRNR